MTRSPVLLLLLTLPWLNPYAAGPAPNVWPWIISAACALGGWLVWRQNRAHIAMLAWLLAATASAALGLAQYFDLAAPFSGWVSQTRPGEAYANLRQRNQFATLTSIGLIALIGGWVNQPKAKRTQYLTYLVVCLLAVGNAASGSRTGFVQWVLIVALTLWWAWPRHPKLAAFAAQAFSFYLGAVITLPWLLGLALGLDADGVLARMAAAPTCASRLVLWSNVGTLIAQKPWFGWGWGELDYAHYITLYPGERFCEILDNAHNLPLHLAVELGIPLALVVCSALAWLVVKAKPWQEKDPVRQMAWGVLAVIGLHSLLEYPLWYGPFQMACVLSVVLLWPQKPAQEKSAQGGWTRKVLSATVVAGLGAALALAAWDYHRISQIYLPQDARDAAYRDDTMRKIGNSWLFRDQVLFAQVSTAVVTRDNAPRVLQGALALLHYSPEPRVIEKLVESAVLLGKDDLALFHLQRYKAAFPEEHRQWQGSRNVPIRDGN